MTTVPLLVCSCLSVKRPPTIVTKQSLKIFEDQAFLHDAAHVTWERINLSPSGHDALSYFKDCCSLLVDEHIQIKNNSEPRTVTVPGLLTTWLF